ncbi:hypothetical protein BC628DRAFT_1357339 [Trametes gibbosa]|nr:hypothetical protein BC628DRAFT_1357339 [Trametes gibbosa]
MPPPSRIVCSCACAPTVAPPRGSSGMAYRGHRTVFLPSPPRFASNAPENKPLEPCMNI